MSTNPKNVLSIDSSIPIQSIEILGVPNYEIEDYNLADQKQFMRYLFDIEKECRKSFEYKQMMRFLKDYGGMNKDSFLENVNMDIGAHIEIHHSPLTLFDIVATIVAKRQACGECLDVPMVAKEVIYCHYKLLVGLIPLCKTVHELVHSQYLFIPEWAVFGNYQEFLQLYDKWIPFEVRSNIESLRELSKDYSITDIAKVLEPHLTRIIVNDSEYQFTNEELYQEINNIIDDLKKKDK